MENKSIGHNDGEAGNRMRVGIMSSWRVPCGVYQYSARLADTLAQIGHTPVILAGRADDHRSVPEESTHEVHDVASIGLWRDDQLYDLDSAQVLDLELDVLHIQYQSMLFNQEPLAELAYRFPGPTAITFHDNCQRPDFPYHVFDLKFTHRQGVGPGDAIQIPFGIEDRPPVVRTFGLGRSRSDYIEPICARNGWVFESASSHEPIHGGGQGWRTHEELIQWLRGADAIVLWYDEQGQAGSSQAARTAMASRRFVVTNNTKWFEDLPEAEHGFLKVDSLDRLERVLRAHLSRQYVLENSWTQVASILVGYYGNY